MTDWIFDDFDPGTQQIAGEKEFKKYSEFISGYVKQLSDIEEALDDSLGDTWDAVLDPITLQNAPYEHASLSDLIKTDHKILNKVMMVFASLCSEIGEHKEKAVNKFYLPLLMYGDGGGGEGDQDGESQLMMARMLELLQDMSMFVGRIDDLIKNTVEQLAALYSAEGAVKVINAHRIHLVTVFEHIGSALSILVTLDRIFEEGVVFKDHWQRYKRVLVSIKGATTEYNVDDSKLRSFERNVMETLEGKLMTGRIFEAGVKQIFNYEVTQNQQLQDEFVVCMRELFVQVDARLVDSREIDTRRNIVGLCGLLVLHHQLFNLPEKKLAKQVWDLYKKIPGPAVHIVGNVMFFHNQFLAQRLPYMMKLLDKKAHGSVMSMREQWLNTSTQNLPSTEVRLPS